ncbi:MAG TPA: cyclase family protein [Isosphaeraceae bacterium]|nr:cyclase family protein [Isosphaeraceae bacterium]
MARRIIDLSMPVHNEMVTFPRIVRPALALYETWEEFAEKIGAARYGVTALTASYLAVLSDHVGTHIDARKHLVRGAPGPEGIPLEACYGDGVLLDFRHKEKGAGIRAAEIEEALRRIHYTLKPGDIVLIWTGAGAYQAEERYLTDHCGMTAEATLWLIEQGIRVMGIDAITFDPPVWAMFERREFWEAHRVMCTHEYYHLENLTNLEAIGRPYGFTVAAFPVKWVGTTAAPVRAVAIIEE